MAAAKNVRVLVYTDENVTQFISRFSTGRYAFQDELNDKGATNYIMGPKEQLTTAIVKDHLDGHKTIGSYAITPSNECLFLCIDFDIESLIAKAATVKGASKKDKERRDAAILAMGENVKATVKGMIEKLGFDRSQILIESSGSKGYHIWLRFKDNVPSLDAYKLTRVLARELDLTGLEIYPRQPSASDEKPGSLIKLPLGINRKTSNRCFFLDDNLVEYPDQWDAFNSHAAVATEQLANLIKLQNTEADKVEEAGTDDLTTIGGSVDRMIDHCDALQAIKNKTLMGEKKGEMVNLTHDERLAILSLFKKFGATGKAKIHQFLHTSENYDYDKTEKNIVGSNILPFRCETMRERGLCQKECQNIMDYNGRSPIKLSMDRNKKVQSAHVLDALAAIENPMLFRRRVRVDFVASAVIGTPYYSVRRRVFEPCNEVACAEYEDCIQEKRDCAKEVFIGNDQKEHIQCHGATDAQVDAMVKARVVGCKCPKNLKESKLERNSIQPFAASNVYSFKGVKKVKDKTENMTDAEKEILSIESKDYIVYHIGTNVETSKTYRGYGTVLQDPHNQNLTILFDKVEPIHGQVETFTVNDSNKQMFELMRSFTLKKWIDEFRDNITRIYERDELILSVLLTHFSALEINFNDTKLPRGWVELMIIGDTGQAKSRLTEDVINYIGLGRVEGSNCTAAGLIGGVAKLQDRQFLQWGVFPRCNKGLLFLDEVQNINPDVWSQLRTVRSMGKAQVAKISSGEHQAQVRLICAANAKPDDRELADFKFGCLSLASIMKPADIRRFDLACFLSKRDLAASHANKYNSPKTPEISQEMVRNAVMWAWSRTADQIKLTKEVTQRILDDAGKLSDKFGQSAAVPLVNVSDMKEKLARLVVACALMNMRTEDFITVTPTLEDCDIIKNLLTKMYSSQNVALDMESMNRTKESEMDDKEYAELKQEIGAESTSSNVYKVMDAVALTDDVRLSDVSMLAGLDDNANISEIIKDLARHNLVKTTRGTYKSTPKLTRFMKKYNSELAAIKAKEQEENVEYVFDGKS